MRTLLLILALVAHASTAHAEPPACPPASPYIGETERNLSRALAFAEQRDVVLSFDEADALFDRATGSQSAHDRYANQEVAYLLARLQRYDSIQPLASNRRALIAGFDSRARRAGMILLETETGVRVLEFSHADRRRAIAYAQATLDACPPR